MKFSIYVSAILSLLILNSCKDAGTNPGYVISADYLIGAWQEVGATETGETIYDRVGIVDSTASGFQFLPEGKFIQHGPDGWCGTPPVNYIDAVGTWAFINKQDIEIYSNYWLNHLLFRIRSISHNRIIARVEIVYEYN